MDTFDPGWWTRATCRAQYSHVESTSPTDQTVWLTIAIIALTVVLEICAYCADRATRAYGASLLSKCTVLCSDADTRPKSPLRLAHSEEENEKSHIYNTHKRRLPPTVYLLISILVLPPTTGVFGVRMLDSQPPSIREECLEVIHPVPSSWLAICVLTILPLISAISAFAKVVYCMVSAPRTRRIEFEVRGRRILWPPALPFAVLGSVGAVCFISVARFVAATTLRIKEMCGDLKSERNGREPTNGTCGHTVMPN
jgi:hypothetical protein